MLTVVGKELGEMHGMGTRPLGTTGVTSRALTASRAQVQVVADLEAQPVVSLPRSVSSISFRRRIPSQVAQFILLNPPTAGSGEGETHEPNRHWSEHNEINDATCQTPIQVELGEIQVGAQTQAAPKVDPNSGV